MARIARAISQRFAVIFALAIYSGQPEILTILAVSVIVFVLTMVIVKTQEPRKTFGAPYLHSSACSSPCVAGTALGAPLALPGLQVLSSINAEQWNAPVPDRGG